MKYIKLTFKAPFMSFGDETSIYQNRRNTAIHPTKSMVIGLIACAMGIPRGDNRIIELNNIITVKTSSMNQEASLWEDYQNAHMSELSTIGEYHFVRDSNGNTKNIQRWKTYVTDGYYLVFVGSPNEELLDCIYKAVNRPYWPLYAGRKCCPFSRRLTETPNVLYNENDLVKEIEKYNSEKGDHVVLCTCQ